MTALRVIEGGARRETLLQKLKREGRVTRAQEEARRRRNLERSLGPRSGPPGAA